MRRPTPRAVVAWARNLVRRDAPLVASLLLIAGGLWVFIEVTDEILENEPEELDTWVINRLHASPGDPLGPAWLTTAALDLTALGGTAVLILLILLVCGYLALRREYSRMWLVLAATILGQTLSSALKHLFGRERPDEAIRLAEVSTSSFPSGHAMMSAVIYLTLGAVLASTRPRRRERVYLVTAAALITGLVGLTRVYLGVHYATDVLAGWSVGLCWATLCLLIAHKLRRAPHPPNPQPTAP